MSLSTDDRHKKLLALPDEEIDYSDLPELDDAFWEHAKRLQPQEKKPISLRVDADVLAFFQKDGPGYQTRMHAVLKAYVETMRSTSKPGPAR